MKVRLNSTHTIESLCFEPLYSLHKKRKKEKQIEIKFDDEKIAKYEFSDLDQIEHSYAITIHKAQRK